jgi:hypothetical protein
MVFRSVRWPRLAELAAQVLFEQQAAAPAMPVDPELEALFPFEASVRAGLPRGPLVLVAAAMDDGPAGAGC